MIQVFSTERVEVWMVQIAAVFGLEAAIATPSGIRNRVRGVFGVSPAIVCQSRVKTN